MDFTFTQQDEAFRQEVRGFIDREVRPHYEDPPLNGAHEYEEWLIDLNKRLAKKLGARGWLGLGWPEEYGGRPATWAQQLIFKEEIGYYDNWGVNRQGINMAGPTILHNGTHEQKKRFLVPMTRGDAWWCQGYSEPGAGSDLAGLQTRADLEGDVFRINGQKIWTSNAMFSDWIFFLVRSDPNLPRHRGISLLAGDLHSPGVTRRPITQMHGASDDFTEIFFDDMRVPKDNLIGGLNQGWYVAMNQLSGERSQIEFVSALKRRIDDLARFIEESGVAHDGSGAAVRQRFADLYVEWTVTRLMNYRVAWMAASGQNTGAAASQCKAMVGPLSHRVSQTAMRILGMHGQLGEYGERVPRAPLQGRLMTFYLRAVARTFNAGTHEVQLNIIATRGLGLPAG